MASASQHTDNRARQSLRLDPAMRARIDRARLQRPGNISRNTWITEAILEKLDRENEMHPPEVIGRVEDV